MGLCEIIFLGVTSKVIWAALATPLGFIFVVTAVGLVSYLVAIHSDKDVEWEFTFRSLTLRWKVSPNNGRPWLVEDGRRPDDATIVGHENEGDVSTPLEQHSAIR